jgi:hypothetical protein
VRTLAAVRVSVGTAALRDAAPPDTNASVRTAPSSTTNSFAPRLVWFVLPFFEVPP